MSETLLRLPWRAEVRKRSYLYCRRWRSLFGKSSQETHTVPYGTANTRNTPTTWKCTSPSVRRERRTFAEDNCHVAACNLTWVATILSVITSLPLKVLIISIHDSNLEKLFDKQIVKFMLVMTRAFNKCCGRTSVSRNTWRKERSLRCLRLFPNNSAQQVSRQADLPDVFGNFRNTNRVIYSANTHCNMADVYSDHRRHPNKKRSPKTRFRPTTNI